MCDIDCPVHAPGDTVARLALLVSTSGMQESQKTLSERVGGSVTRRYLGVQAPELGVNLVRAAVVSAR
jgi:hypothetical protein